MNKFFIIKTGFNPEDFIEISDKELDKAIFCQINGIVGIFEKGTINGKYIVSIKEDWHKQMGWKRGYKLTGEDFDAIRIDDTCKSYRGLIAASKERVNHFISINRSDLIGKIDDIKKLN